MSTKHEGDGITRNTFLPTLALGAPLLPAIQIENQLNMALDLRVAGALPLIK
jgi:hypothetical protein